MESFKSKQDFDAAIEIIDDGIKNIVQGKKAHFRSVATQLYILLIDRGEQKGPLVTEFIPSFKLHPLGYAISREGRSTPLEELRKILGEYSTLFPQKISFIYGKPISTWMFDDTAPTISLELWLDQPLLNFNTTIKKLLKSVVSPRFKTTLQRHVSIEILDRVRFRQLSGLFIDLFLFDIFQTDSCRMKRLRMICVVELNHHVCP